MPIVRKRRAMLVVISCRPLLRMLAVRAHCRARLTDYKVPETITWSDTPLPRNAGGKLLKRMLREQLA